MLLTTECEPETSDMMAKKSRQRSRPFFDSQDGLDAMGWMFADSSAEVECDIDLIDQLN